MVLHGISLYLMVSHSFHVIPLYRMVLHGIVLYLTVLHGIALLGSARGLYLARHLSTLCCSCLPPGQVAPKIHAQATLVVSCQWHNIKRECATLIKTHQVISNQQRLNVIFGFHINLLIEFETKSPPMTMRLKQELFSCFWR